MFDSAIMLYESTHQFLHILSKSLEKYYFIRTMNTLHAYENSLKLIFVSRKNTTLYVSKLNNFTRNFLYLSI